MITVNGGSPAFTNCTFRHSANYGIYHSGVGVSASVSGSSFENNASYPLYWNSQFVHQIGADNSFSGNTYQRILLRSNNLTAAETWSNKGIPLELEDHLFLKNYETTLQVQAGTQVLFRSGKRLYVGDANYFNSAGSIQASGAIFGAVDPVLGWSGIYCYPYTQPSLLSGCTIRDGTPRRKGRSQLRQPLCPANCTFTNNSNYGLYCCNGRNFSPLTALYRQRQDGGPLRRRRAETNGGNVYTSNTENRILCFGGTIDQPQPGLRRARRSVVKHCFQHHRHPVLQIPPEWVIRRGKFFFVGDELRQQPQLKPRA